MLRDRMHGTLKHLGINDSNYRVLKLLPLVYVAWADGRVDPEEEERIIELCHEEFSIGAKGERLVRGWMKKRPTLEYFEEGLRDLVFLAHAPDEWGCEVDELPGLLLHAEEIARASGEVVGAPSSVDANEQQALRSMAGILGVSGGESWAELLEELR